jgi:hypothetical protein
MLSLSKHYHAEPVKLHLLRQAQADTVLKFKRLKIIGCCHAEFVEAACRSTIMLSPSNHTAFDKLRLTLFLNFDA